MILKFIAGLALTAACCLVCAQNRASNLQAGDYVDVGGSKVWYEQCAPPEPHAPAVVLLHDGLLHSVTWDDIWAPLCANHHVLRYDRRGYGRSEPAKIRFVPDDDLSVVMHRAHIDQAIIIGNSSGGGLALDFALSHPEMVEGLLLIGPVVHGMASSEYFNERGAKNSAPLDRNDAKAAADNWSKDRFIIGGDDQRARKTLYEALLQNPQNLQVSGGLEIRPSPPTVVRLSQIKVPTLVLVGDADIGDVFAYSGAIEAMLPVASFEIWKDTGHLIQLQRPAELVARLNRFVALVERKEVVVPGPKLSEYIGQYKLANRSANVALREGGLMLEIPGAPYYWLFPASETRFFLRTEEIEVEFPKDAKGRIAEMVVHNSDGSLIRCPRISSDQP